MIIVEQKPKKILPFTDQAIVLDRGAIAHAAPSAELLADPAALDAHLTATKKAGRVGDAASVLLCAASSPTATARRREIACEKSGD